MHFFDIPEEVIKGGICKHLACNDLLRLRTVCKKVKDFVDDHFRVLQLAASQEFEINETDKPLRTYIDVETLATLTRFYLNTTSVTFFTDFQADIDAFLEKYGDKITHLRVRFFHTFAVPREMEFYQSLSNLKHLELEEVDATTRSCLVMVQDKRKYPSPFPPNFKQLETLKLGLIHPSKDTPFQDHNYQWDFFDFCEKLVYFKHALYENIEPLTHSHRGGIFGSIPEAIPARKEKHPDGPHLKYYDIQNMFQDDLETGSFDMFLLLETCLHHDVKLVNVDASMLGCICTRMKDHLGVGNPILSLHNIRANLFFLEMPNVETITISALSACTMAEDRSNFDPDWPKLKALHVNVDPVPEENVDNATELVDFVFDREEPERKHVTELTLRFSIAIPGHSIPYPDVCCIVTTCPNLTKLTLATYPHSAPNKAYSLLWKGLKLLVELCIEDAPTLGNAGFVGKDVKNPIFLQLTRLRKLTLRNMEKMTKTTDTVFKLVLQHMKLTHLILQSNEPVKSITTAGVSSLLAGDFAQSIEKFPFQGWSIDGVSDEEFQNLGSQFRSLDMPS